MVTVYAVCLLARSLSRCGRAGLSEEEEEEEEEEYNESASGEKSVKMFEKRCQHATAGN